MTFEQVFIVVFLMIYGSMFYTLGRQHSVQMIDKLLEEKIKCFVKCAESLSVHIIQGCIVLKSVLIRQVKRTLRIEMQSRKRFTNQKNQNCL